MTTLKESLQQNLFIDSLDNYHTERRRNGTVELYSEGDTIRADLEYHRGTGLYTSPHNS